MTAVRSGTGSIERRGTALAGRALAAGVVIAALASTAAADPRVAALASPLLVLGTVALRMPRAAIPGAAALLVAAVGLALCLAAWPVTTSLAVIVCGSVVLAWRSPAWAVAVGVLLIGFEGTVKILLGLEATPLPFSNRAVGAAAIDAALFTAVLGVLASDRGRALRGLWAAGGRAERGALVLLATWFLVSVLQIAQGGDLERGLHGFRLFQAYVLVGVSAAVIFARPRMAAGGAAVVLGIGLVVSLYAAVRVLIGPAAAEESFALSVDTVTQYGDAVRAVGSFSSAVGMGSFLTPVAVFAFGAGLLLPRLRVAGLTVGSLALVGILASYGRTLLMGIAAGLLCLFALVVLGSNVPARRKRGAAALVLTVLAAAYGGVLVASQASPRLEERAQGVIDPFGDESLRLRLETWERTLDDVRERPLGHGVGTAGAASATVRGKRGGLVTTDNSFLKVLLEQGIPVSAVFFSGILALTVLLGRRLTRLSGDERAVGVPALCAFVSFLTLATMGEAVEQPGKVLAWGFLGMALSLALPGAGGARRGRGEP